MSPLILIAAILLIAVVGAAKATQHRRRLLLRQLRSTWGVAHKARQLSDPDATAELHHELADDAAAKHGVDDRTWADLDLDRVTATISNCHTLLGSQVLYHRLRSGAVWRESPRLEELAGRFTTDAALRENVGVHLAAAGRVLGENFWHLTRSNSIQTRWWYWAFPVLTAAMALSIAGIMVEPRLLLVALGLLPLSLGARLATAWQLPGLLAAMRQLKPLLSSADHVEAALDRGGVGSAEWRDDIKALQPLERIGSWVSRDPLSAGELAAGLYEYLNLLFILDANALLFGARQLRRDADRLGRAAITLGEVDLALSVASLRAQDRDWSIPEWDDSAQRSDAVAVWHPLVAEPIPNDAELISGAGLIITGANMSGKSTYIRTIGIAAVLARALNTVPAASWHGRSLRVRSLIGRADDLAAGKSYYQVEAEGVVQLLHESAEPVPTIFLLDELLRGTNTVERLAAGEAVLRYLLRDGSGSQHSVIVATHDGELVSLLSDLYRPFHFRETMAGAELHFDYRRQEGEARTRTAISLLQAAGAPPEVIEGAREGVDGGTAKG